MIMLHLRSLQARLFALGISAAISVWLQPASAEITSACHQEADRVASELIKELGSALQEQMKTAGQEAAINVCADLAPRIVNRVSREKGWRVTRVGTRVRNPLLGMPDQWEQGVLADFKQKAISGEAFESMSFSEVVDELDGRYFRYMKPLTVKPVCLACHGDPAQIPGVIREMYPHDMATGYQTGDLRGAVSIKRPLKDQH